MIYVPAPINPAASHKFKPNFIKLGILVLREILISQGFFLIASKLELYKIKIIFFDNQTSNAPVAPVP